MVEHSAAVLAFIANLILIGVIGLERWSRRKDVEGAVAAKDVTQLREELRTMHTTGSDAVKDLSKELAVLQNDHENLKREYENLKRYINKISDGDR
jgi:ribosome recycling factor